MKKLIFIFLFLISFQVHSDSTETTLEKKVDAVELDDLKDILIKDKLYENAEKQKLTLEKIKKARTKVAEVKSYYPNQKDFWEVASEYWLVKNAPLLNWDFDKPAYGIGVDFQKTLIELGIVEKSIKILYSKNEIAPHFALPSSSESYIFFLSVPFIKVMDLSKREVSMLLLEDLLRTNQEYFVANIKDNKFLSNLGKEINESQSKAAMSDFNKLINEYSDIIFNRGYTFQQQFETTKKMNELLKPFPEYWNAYYQLCLKRDLLTRANALYKNYMKIYPSPVMQLTWLKPAASTSIP